MMHPTNCPANRYSVNAVVYYYHHHYIIINLLKQLIRMTYTYCVLCVYMLNSII